MLLKKIRSVKVIAAVSAGSPFLRSGSRKSASIQAAEVSIYRKIQPLEFCQAAEGSSILNPSIQHFNSRTPIIIYKENIWTVPNILCATRIAITPYLGHLILCSDLNLACWCMMFAGLTDMLDGFIARNWYSQSTKLGSFLDPIADKILIATLFSTMTYSNLIPGALTLLIVSRDLFLASAGFYIRFVSLPPPRTLTRYFDGSYVTAQLNPTRISKLNTLVQLATVAVTLTAYTFHCDDERLLTILWCVTATTTVLSAGSYILSRNTFKILGNSSSKGH